MDRFRTCLDHLLREEGGWSDRPLKDDPGGPTMQGVTQTTYDAFRRQRGQPLQSVRQITPAERDTLYERQYWRAAGCAKLPVGLDHVVFDFAVNSGPGTAVMHLQRIVGARDDGVVGMLTLDRVDDRDPVELIHALSDARLAYMRGLRNWGANRNGWKKRVERVRRAALAAAGVHVVAAPPPEAAPAPAKARPEAVAAGAVLKDMVATPEALSALGGVLGALGSLASGDGPVQWAMAVALVATALGGLYALLRQRRARG